MFFLSGTVEVCNPSENFASDKDIQSYFIVGKGKDLGAMIIPSRFSFPDAQTLHMPVHAFFSLMIQHHLQIALCEGFKCGFPEIN